MKSICIFTCCMFLLIFSFKAEAYCVYNMSDSDLSVEVHDGGSSYYIFKFEEIISPGSSKCCPGGNSECKGDLWIYCKRYGQKVGGNNHHEVGNRGWIKVKCTRDSTNEPYRIEVIEKQFKVD